MLKRRRGIRSPLFKEIAVECFKLFKKFNNKASFSTIKEFKNIHIDSKKNKHIVIKDKLILNDSKELIESRKISIPSFAEKKISDFLFNNEIKFIREYYHPKLKNDRTGKLLFLDFYIRKLKLAIEYDGKHHFKNKKEILEAQIYKDKIKDDWCKENNIFLIRLNSNHIKNLEIHLSHRLNENYNLK